VAVASNTPQTPKAPSLPFAEVQYSKDYLNQLCNILRLYFNQLDNVNSQLLSVAGGSILKFPNGSFYLTTQQTIPVINTAYAIPFNNTAEANQVAIGTTTSHIVTSISGYYNFQFSLQLAKTGGSNIGIWVWPRVNGVDIAESNTKLQLTGSSSSESVAAWNFVLPMNAGDYFQLMWAADDTRAIIKAEAANAFSPAIPPVILTATFVSALYS
jgi:hypothetical protein